MSKVTICPSGHHYDAEKYSICPHCANNLASSADMQDDEQNQKETASKKRRSIFDSSKKHASYIAQSGSMNDNPPQPFDVQRVGSTLPLYAQELNKTVPLYAQEIQKTVPLYANEIDEGRQVKISVPKTDFDSHDDQQKTAEKPVSDLQKAVNATNSGAVKLDTKTIGFFDIEEEVPSTQQHIEPTVGWIVCVRGAHKGESFVLRTGRNSIGRDESMDVVLGKETTVSRNKHAHIIFDPLNVKYILQAGDGHGLTYKNGEMVMTFTDLQSFDRFMLGQAEFVFVAFCGEKFNWA